MVALRARRLVWPAMSRMRPRRCVRRHRPARRRRDRWRRRFRGAGDDEAGVVGLCGDLADGGGELFGWRRRRSGRRWRPGGGVLAELASWDATWATSMRCLAHDHGLVVDGGQRLGDRRRKARRSSRRGVDEGSPVPARCVAPCGECVRRRSRAALRRRQPMAPISSPRTRSTTSTVVSLPARRRMSSARRTMGRDRSGRRRSRRRRQKAEDGEKGPEASAGAAARASERRRSRRRRPRRS